MRPSGAKSKPDGKVRPGATGVAVIDAADAGPAQSSPHTVTAAASASRWSARLTSRVLISYPPERNDRRRVVPERAGVEQRPSPARMQVAATASVPRKRRFVVNRARTPPPSEQRVT